MQIKSRLISQEHSPLVIAEIGINHGGSLDVAKKMVLAAYQSGCEMVKHQTHFVDDEMTGKGVYLFFATRSYPKSRRNFGTYFNPINNLGQPFKWFAI